MNLCEIEMATGDLPSGHFDFNDLLFFFKIKQSFNFLSKTRHKSSANFADGTNSPVSMLLIAW